MRHAVEIPVFGRGRPTTGRLRSCRRVCSRQSATSTAPCWSAPSKVPLHTG